jgi:hypothetical protein
MQFLTTLDLDSIVLTLSAMVVLLVLVKWHFSTEVDFDLKHIVMQDGKISLSKFGQLVAMFISTWVVVYQTRHNQLTEWIFTGYMLAWSGANFASKYLDKRTADTK